MRVAGRIVVVEDNRYLGVDLTQTQNDKRSGRVIVVHMNCQGRPW